MMRMKSSISLMFWLALHSVKLRYYVMQQMIISVQFLLYLNVLSSTKMPIILMGFQQNTSALKMKTQFDFIFLLEFRVILLDCITYDDGKKMWG